MRGQFWPSEYLNEINFQSIMQHLIRYLYASWVLKYISVQSAKN